VIFLALTGQCSCLTGAQAWVHRHPHTTPIHAMEICTLCLAGCFLCQCACERERTRKKLSVCAWEREREVIKRVPWHAKGLLALNRPLGRPGWTGRSLPPTTSSEIKNLKSYFHNKRFGHFFSRFDSCCILTIKHHPYKTNANSRCKG
jgi:hypothetical protein